VKEEGPKWGDSPGELYRGWHQQRKGREGHVKRSYGWEEGGHFIG